MKTLEQLAAETFPYEGLCPSKTLTAKYNQAKMVKAVRKWMEQGRYVPGESQGYDGTTIRWTHGNPVAMVGDNKGPEVVKIPQPPIQVPRQGLNYDPYAPGQSEADNGTPQPPRQKPPKPEIYT